MHNSFCRSQGYENKSQLVLDPVFHPEALGIKNATYWTGGRAEEIRDEKKETRTRFAREPGRQRVKRLILLLKKRPHKAVVFFSITVNQRFDVCLAFDLAILSLIPSLAM